MTKAMNRITIACLSVILVVAMVVSFATVAFAEEGESAVAQTRDYNELLDRMLDDGTSSEAEPAYRAISWAAGKCDDLNDPIYKFADPIIAAGFDTLSIELRSVDESIKLADLKIALHTVDDDAIVESNSYVLSDDRIKDAIELSEGTDIGSNWTIVTFDFTQSEIQVNGAAFDTTKEDAVSGFHLYVADSTKAGKLDIRKISVEKAGTETVIGNFADIKPSWWDGTDAGCFTNIPKAYNITSSKEIKSSVATSNNTDEKYSAIVLQIAGSGNVSVAPIGEDGTVGTAVAWSSLKDLEGVAVSELDGTYRNAVISLESLGQSKIQGVKVSVEDGSVNVAKAFFTSMETIAPDKKFPTLDMDSAVYMTQFGFNYTPSTDYPKAVEDCATFGCDYILSYSNPVPVVKDGHAVLNDPANYYTDIIIRSKVASEGRRYLVLKYILKDGATLDNFRFRVVNTETDIVSAEVYANQLLAGNLLYSLSELNPYSDGDYKYLVVDLERTFGDTYISGIQMYYSGAGEMLVDEIFYADAVKPSLDLENKHVFDSYDKLPANGDADYWWVDMNPTQTIVDGAIKISVPLNTSVCVGYAKPGNNKDWNHQYMVIRMKADNLTMETFRIVWLDDSTTLAKDGHFKTLSGEEFVLTDEYQDFVIDLDASGINRAIEGFRLWLGGWGDEAGDLYIDEIYFADKKEVVSKEYTATGNITAGDGYHYISGGDFANVNQSRYLKLDLTALNTFNFNEFRIALHIKDADPVEIWSGASTFELQGGVTLGEGEEAEMRTQSVIFDLEKLDIKYEDIIQVHAHMSAADSASSVTVGVTFFDYVPGMNSIEIPTHDDTAPILTASVATSATQGDEITITASAVDNYSETVTITYEVTLNGNAITVKNGKFTATEAGTYTVKVTAKDEAGNEQVFTKALTVSAGTPDPVEPTQPEQPTVEQEGLSGGAIAGIVIGAVAVVAIVVAVIVIIRRKRSK